MPDIREFGDRLEPRLRRQFLEAVAAARAVIDEKELVALIEAGNRDAIYRLGVELAERSLIPNLAGWVQTILTVTRAAAMSTIALAGSLTRINDFALRWVREHAAAQVTGIAWDTTISIRHTIDRLFTGTGPTNVQAAAMLIRNSVGILPSHADALNRYWESMMKAGVPLEKAAKNADTYYRRLLAWRAETIARTETIYASHAGLLAGWHAAVAEGRLGFDVRKKWMVTEDDRLCERCAPMDGQSVPLDSDFLSNTKGFPEGLPTDAGPGSKRRRKTGLKPGSKKAPHRLDHLDGVLVASRPVRVPHPPLHPNCRCTMVLDIPS